MSDVTTGRAFIGRNGEIRRKSMRVIGKISRAYIFKFLAQSDHRPITVPIPQIIENEATNVLERVHLLSKVNFDQSLKENKKTKTSRTLSLTLKSHFRGNSFSQNTVVNQQLQLLLHLVL